MARARKIIFSAGEASGDANAAALAAALKEREPELSLSGMGGPKMAQAGVDILIDYKSVNVVGIMEVLPKLFGILAAWRSLKKTLRREKPAALITVDLPDFNFRLARAAKAAGVPVIWYIAPQVWAWRRGRVKKMRRLTRLVISIMPFERDWFEQNGVQVFYAGHPMVDRPAPGPEAEAALRREAGWRDGRPFLALLPGSRGSEIRSLLPVMVETARRIAAQRPDTGLLIPVAPGRKKQELAGAVAALKGPTIHLTDRPTQEVLSFARAALVCSGTASLEAAMARCPMAVVYRTNPLSYLIGRALIRGDRSLVALPNLVASDLVENKVKVNQVVPVLLQKEVEPGRLSSLMLDLLAQGPARTAMLAGLDEIRRRMGEPGSAGRAATRILEVINHG